MKTGNSCAPESVASQQRRRWMSILARSSRVAIEQVWEESSASMEFNWLRKPHTGLVMIRGRAGGTGNPFNLGEMTVSRCALQISSGVVGHGYVQGRDHRHVELAAKLDALLQTAEQREKLLAIVIEPLHELQVQRHLARSRKAASTKVEFFTMVRGENSK
jgi:alpha-D-ribose 1-methylphosphonate 5-triphosphate synthase subunit PhnG